MIALPKLATWLGICPREPHYQSHPTTNFFEWLCLPLCQLSNSGIDKRVRAPPKWFMDEFHVLILKTLTKTQDFFFLSQKYLGCPFQVLIYICLHLHVSCLFSHYMCIDFTLTFRWTSTLMHTYMYVLSYCHYGIIFVYLFLLLSPPPHVFDSSPINTSYTDCLFVYLPHPLYIFFSFLSLKTPFHIDTPPSLIPI